MLLLCHIAASGVLNKCMYVQVISSESAFMHACVCFRVCRLLWSLQWWNHLPLMQRWLLSSSSDCFPILRLSG